MSSLKTIVGKVPFIRYTTAFVIGIIAANTINFHPFLWVILIGDTTLLLYLRIFHTQKRPAQQHLYSFSTALLFVVSASIYTSLYFQTLFDTQLPEKGQYQGTIVEINKPSSTRNCYTLKVEAAIINDSILPIDEKIILYVPQTPETQDLSPGERISFRSTLYPINSSNNPGEFDYQKFMKQKGIRYRTYLFAAPSVIPMKNNSLKTIAINIRFKLLDTYRKADLSDDVFAVLAALTLGDKNYLSKELKSSFAASGAMHVLAVSGLHVGILYFIIKMLLSPLPKRKKIRLLKIIFILFLLWSYAFITGLSPSVLRSCTMFSFIVVGENFNRKTNIYNTLAVSAFTLMLIQPTILFQVGFQLSYAAVSSIVFFQPKIAGLIHSKNPILNYTWNLFAVSLAAQIGTFPISIFYFHQFPSYFWISNFVVIPTTGILLYTAVLFFVTPFLPFVHNALSLLLKLLVKTMNFSVQGIEQLPGSVIDNLWIDPITLLLLIVSIITMAIFLENKKIKTLMFTILLAMSIMAYSIRNELHIKHQKVIIFYNTYSDPMISFISGKSHYYYSTSDSIQQHSVSLLNNARGQFHTLPVLPIQSIDAKSNGFVQWEDYIFCQNISIKINHQKETSSKINNTSCDISWNPKTSKIEIQNKSNVAPYLMDKNKKMEVNNNEFYSKKRAVYIHWINKKGINRIK